VNENEPRRHVLVVDRERDAVVRLDGDGGGARGRGVADRRVDPAVARELGGVEEVADADPRVEPDAGERRAQEAGDPGLERPPDVRPEAEARALGDGEVLEGVPVGLARHRQHGAVERAGVGRDAHALGGGEDHCFWGHRLPLFLYAQVY